MLRLRCFSLPTLLTPGRLAAVGSALVAAFLFPSCSTIKVKVTDGAVLRDSIASARNLAMLDEAVPAEDTGETCAFLLKYGKKLELRGRKTEAAGCYLETALRARAHLVSDRVGVTADTKAEVVKLHNDALAKFAEIWAEDDRRYGKETVTYSCGKKSFEVSTAIDTDYHVDFFDKFVAAESIKEKGMEEEDRDGLGAKLVGIRWQTAERAEEMKYFADRGLHVPVSATVDEISAGADGVKHVRVSLHNPLLQDTVEQGKYEYPLAADFSAPIGMTLEGRSEKLWGLTGFFKAEVLIENAGIYLTEPYDPNRIPVIFSHGLISSPIIWKDMIPAMQSEIDISKRYQFMVFTYPSSLTIPESARLFRNRLAELRARYDPDGNDPLTRNMVAAGHSMGGVLTHLLVCEMGNHLWEEVSEIPLEEFQFPELVENEVRSLAFFDPDPAVVRAVYFSAPHGGAKMAEWKLANIASQMAKLPRSVLNAPASLLEVSFPRSDKIDLGKKMTSIQSLRPDAPIILALQEAPYKHGVVYHSIIGDRGKGDTPDSSDGVVEYWSSHQPGAESELIVPTDHGSYDHEKSIAEMKRILRVHAGLSSASAN